MFIFLIYSLLWRILNFALWSRWRSLSLEILILVFCKFRPSITVCWRSFTFYLAHSCWVYRWVQTVWLWKIQNFLVPLLNSSHYQVLWIVFKRSMLLCWFKMIRVLSFTNALLTRGSALRIILMLLNVLLENVRGL